MTKKAEKMPTPERVILLVAGESGTGKSFFVGNLKNARIYDTDIGGGLSYLDERIARNGSTRIEVGSYPEIMEDLKRHRSELKTITTLAIDHLSTLQAEAVLRHNPHMSDDFGRSYDRATREWKKLREVARWGDFNLVCTAHMKSKYESNKVTGITTDASKNVEADFFTVLYLQQTTEYPSLARVKKWRRDPEDLRGMIPSTFEFTLSKFMALHGVPLDTPRVELKLASPAQVAELERLLNVVKLPEDTVQKWLTKAKAESFDEFSEDTILKCIAYLNDTVQNGAKGAA